MTQRAYCTLLIVTFMLPAAAATAEDAEKHLLQYRFSLGETLRYRVEHDAHVRSTIEETTQEVESTSESIKAWRVTDVLPDGQIEFIHVVESAKMSNKRPKQPVAEFDSTSDAPPAPLFAAAAKSIGVPLTLIRMTPDGKIVHREEKHQQPEATDDMPITLRLPGKSIVVGDKWDQVYDVQTERKTGAKLTIKTRRLCELQSVKQGVATIRVSYQILTPVDAYTQSQLVERLTTGVVRFDIERGRILSQQHDVDKRILGFAGKTSRMHFTARLQERLVEPNEKIAQNRPAAQ